MIKFQIVKPTFQSIIKLHSSSSFLFLLIFCGVCWDAALGTEIKWVPNEVDEKSADAAAKTAPRSQKYWDEHNIPRPDYAKTDLEILEEQGGSLHESWWPNPVVTVLIVGMALGLAAGLYVKVVIDPLTKTGLRLGSADSSALEDDASFSVEKILSRIGGGNNRNDNMTPAERARQARLERFAFDSSESKID